LAGLAVECVRGVLRDDESDLSYEDGDRVQKAIKQAFGIEGYYTSKELELMNEEQVIRCVGTLCRIANSLVIT
jgi:hypothetical protein